MGVLGSLGQLYMFILLVLLFMGSGFALWSFINHLTKSNTAKTKPVTQQMKINENKERKILGGIKMANNGWFKLAIFSFVGILISMVVLGVMTSNGAQMGNVPMNGNMNNNMNNTMQMSNMQMQNNAQMNNMNGNMQMQGNMNGNMQMGNMPMQGNMQMTNMPMNNNMPMQGGMQNGNTQMTNDPNAMMMQQLNQMQMQLNQMQQQMNQMNQMNNSGGSSSGSMSGGSGGGMGMM